MNDIARSCAEKRAAEYAEEVARLSVEKSTLANRARQLEGEANELRSNYLSALDVIQQGIAREDAMRAEIARLGEKLCAEQIAAAKTIGELNDRIVSMNLEVRAKRTGGPA